METEPKTQGAALGWYGAAPVGLNRYWFFGLTERERRLLHPSRVNSVRCHSSFRASLGFYFITPRIIQLAVGGNHEGLANWLKANS